MVTISSPQLQELSASQISLQAPSLPPYSEYPQDVELDNLTSSSLSEGEGEGVKQDATTKTKASKAVQNTRLATSSSPSSSSAAITRFRPTVLLQIQAEGKRLFSFPLCTNTDPIPVFDLEPDGRLHRPLYFSVRLARGSSSCVLVDGDDEIALAGRGQGVERTLEDAALVTTTYRFGPGRPPVIRMAPYNSNRSRPTAAWDEEDEEETMMTSSKDVNPQQEDEEIEVRSAKTFSRAQSLQTSLGTFEWRYARSKEREFAAAAAGGASSPASGAPIDNLLVLELVSGSENDASSTNNRSYPVRVAQLVRSQDFRTPGTSRAAAGNGGRLMLDLSGFDEKVRETVQRLAVASAIVMLKKEVDRRQMQQMATIAAIV